MDKEKLIAKELLEYTEELYSDVIGPFPGETALLKHDGGEVILGGVLAKILSIGISTAEEIEKILQTVPQHPEHPWP